ncbi:biopolymer transporter ExbD [uncultured Hyphomonas sp.]|jgi:biopolymer transport protein ExbD|uniref:ExbD/TolR family protein n=1 Tax=uncultured Hyphomonas sp. TaxID=225298 RepID=UPI001A5714F0|nr:biopolymer transporter ExbD [Hyphomonas sp.]|tara:strand:+ start:34438 stop:34818 length:381 start_codon:yes stop_codon:yes gene_type:complete
MKRRRQKAPRDPVISLINIVFLILIFFMVAGSLSSPPDPSIRFVQTEDLDCCVAPDAVAIDAAGELRRSGIPIDLKSLLNSRNSDTTPLRLLPDRDLPAAQLLELVKELRANGQTDIIIVTEDTTL